MKKIVSLLLLVVVLVAGCNKKNDNRKPGCNMQKVYNDNAAKVTIAAGIWGTVAFTEGNCMPAIDPKTTTCKTCPVQRVIRIYAYTTINEATPQNRNGFYDSFSTTLIKEFRTDENGFFQTEIPAGHYTIVAIENGKLYAFGGDGQGGIGPLTVTSGKQQVNLTFHYKAAF